MQDQIAELMEELLTPIQIKYVVPFKNLIPKNKRSNIITSLNGKPSKSISQQPVRIVGEN
jgi:hypothetical protein